MGLSTIRDGIKTALEGAEGGGLELEAARVVLGRDVLSETNTFLSALEADGPYCIVLPGAKNAELNDATNEYEVPLRLYIGIPKGSDHTFDAIEQLIEDMEAELSPHVLTWDRPEITIHESTAVVAYEMTVQAMGC